MNLKNNFKKIMLLGSIFFIVLIFSSCSDTTTKKIVKTYQDYQQTDSKSQNTINKEELSAIIEELNTYYESVFFDKNLEVKENLKLTPEITNKFAILYDKFLSEFNNKYNELYLNAKEGSSCKKSLESIKYNQKIKEEDLKFIKRLKNPNLIDKKEVEAIKLGITSLNTRYNLYNLGLNSAKISCKFN